MHGSCCSRCTITPNTYLWLAHTIYMPQVVTEARVLKLDLPGHAVEAGIRTFAAGKQNPLHCVIGWPAATICTHAVLADACSHTVAGGAAIITSDLQARCHAHPRVLGPRRAIWPPLLLVTTPAGGQWQRAVDMMEALAAQGQHAEHHTAEAVFKALADGQQAERALQLLEVSSP